MNKIIYFLIMSLLVVSNIVLMPNYEAPPVGTPISSVPYHITSPGKYYLTQDFFNASTTAYKCIHIQASNVELDGMGHILDGTDNSMEAGIGVIDGTSPWYQLTNVTIKNIILTDWGGTGPAAILFYYVRYGNIINVTAYSNQEGIRLQYYSSYNYMANNSIHNNTKYGFELWETAHDNTMENNTVNNNNLAGFKIGYPAYESDNNILKDNIVKYNNNGFYIEPGSNNIIESNYIAENYYNGIIISSSSYNNIIRENTIESNPIGVYITSPANYNYIYHNNFIDNTDNGNDGNTGNKWYNQNTNEGNYWDDYTGIDGNSDGIGDTPYNVTATIQDLYPFMVQWGWQPTPTLLHVDDEYTITTPGWDYDRFNKIQDAIDAATDDVDILIHAGDYNEELVIDKTLNITGEGINTIICPDSIPHPSFFDVSIEPGASDTNIQMCVFDFNGADDKRSGTGFMIGNLSQDPVTNVKIHDTVIYTGNGSGVGGTAIRTSNNTDISGLIISSNEIYCDETGSGEAIHINPFSGSGIVTIYQNAIFGNISYGISVEANNTHVIDNYIDSNFVNGIYGICFTDSLGGRTFDGVNISYNDIFDFNYGIFVGTSTDVGSSLTAEIFSNNATENNIGIMVGYGADLQDSIHFNRIFSNFDYGVNNIGSSIVDATMNWWGSITGPYHPVNNSDGFGDNVSDNVDFNPWINLNGAVIYSDDVQINLTSGGDIEDNLDFMDLAGLTLVVNTSNSINITVVNYSSNPEDIPVGIQTLGRYIDIDVEDWGEVNPPINITMYYTQDDLDNTDLTEEIIHGIYFWNDTSSDWELFNNTGVNTTDQFDDYIGYCWANVWHLTPIIIAGGEINLPSNITGLTVTDAKDGKLDLSWNSGTDDTDVDYYNIYRDYGGTPITTVNHPTITYRDSGLTNGQTYWYEISAVDVFGNEGNKSDAVSGKPTKTSSGGGSSGGGTTPAENEAPVADANGPYNGYIDVAIIFDGSSSYDSDGIITDYSWSFGDGTSGSGKKPTHTYTAAGTYTISLTVTDNDGDTDTDSTTVSISDDSDDDGWNDDIEDSYGTDKNDPNDNPTDTDDDGKPDEDSPDGEYTGDTDDDNDGISDVIEELIGTDPKDETSYIIIDIEDIENYLVDTDDDGEYDLFYDPESEIEITFEIDEDGNILIDYDNDGEWDYKYDMLSSDLTDISEEEDEETPGFGFIMIIVVLGLIGFIYKRRK
jgi:parallel beta-helix repeat protein